MRILAIGAFSAMVAGAAAQSIDQVYNRDTHEPFQLKNVKIDRTVVGPIVRTSTLLTFANPYKKLTEASLWFGMPEAAALGGFAYYYGDEYVKGQLMDKAKAWFIYTAITSRNRDPGIMDQVNPTYYHAQIYPLKVGTDLKVRLYTVGMVEPKADGTHLPLPSFRIAPNVQKDMTVRIGHGKPSTADEAFTLPAMTTPIHAVAQRFKDGKTYVAGVLRNDTALTPKIKGLRDVKLVSVSDSAVAFMGWVPRNRTLKATTGTKTQSFRPQMIYKGSEAARLWAQQKLANWNGPRGREVLKFSLKYGVPSNMTALLAVPKQEMELFRKKEKEFQKQQALERQREREEARRQREWARNRQQNWNQSSGGDPEIRVAIPNAKSVYAVLPDGRILDLRESQGYWGVNFDIPVSAPEGKYEVKLVATRADGTREVRTLSYNVDRTAPEGKVDVKVVDGKLRIEVRAEAGLAQVAAWLPDGRKLVFKEEEPGVYRLELPDAKPIQLAIQLTDAASNKRTLTCFWPR